MKVLVLDIGGSNVKMRVTGQQERTKFPSGPDYSPKQLVSDLSVHAKGWNFDAVTVGFPGPILAGTIPVEPKNLGTGWVGFDFEKALGKPVKLINDAAMQAVGVYEGGRLLFLSLGTGLGAALIVDYHVIPLELCRLRWSKNSSLEDRLGKESMNRQGPDAWERSVHQAVGMLRAAFIPDSIVIGGGGAKHLAGLPENTRRGHNNDALAGGELLWTDPRFRL